MLSTLAVAFVGFGTRRRSFGCCTSCNQESRNDRCSRSPGWSCRLAGACNRRTNLRLLEQPRRRCKGSRIATSGSPTAVINRILLLFTCAPIAAYYLLG